ncbi:MAG: methyltransferase [Devosia sp.]|nr:methyltransferase [Devosia sp.]
MSLDHPTRIVKYQTATRDAFLGGRLAIAQPVKGFRAGLDSVLLGAAVGATKGWLLDLGAGVGTAALVALAHHPDLVATLVDSDPEALALAAENVATNGFAGRAQIVALDITAPGAARAAAGLQTDHYTAVIANPPFFTAGQGTSASARGRAARHMDAGALDLWVKTAAASVAPGGEIVFILPAESLAPALAAFNARFGAITILPFAPRAGEAAGRILLRGIKGSRAPSTLLATRALHQADGQAFSPEMEAILRDAALLVW